MKKKSPFVFLVLFLIAFMGSFILFSLPGSSLPSIYWINIPHLDKFIHIGIFFTLCFSASVVVNQYHAYKINYLTTLFLCLAFIIYGIGIEFYQENYIEGRAFEFADIIADGIGCSLFLLWFLIGDFTKKSWSR